MQLKATGGSNAGYISYGSFENPIQLETDHSALLIAIPKAC
jgi:hypothetical protein